MNDLPKYWDEYLKQAKIETFRWHDLRHVCQSSRDGGRGPLRSEETFRAPRHENSGAICAPCAPFFERSGGLTDE
jgi:hypothetical protein